MSRPEAQPLPDVTANLADTSAPLDLVWGVVDIAKFIRRTKRQTYEALAKGELPARLVNRRWVASRRRLREYFEGVADAG